MLICGIQKLSLLDYPGKIAATIFTGGCNLRCPFCHNAPLVTELSDSPSIPEEEILDFLSHRVGKLDGVCITGGEPLLQPDLAAFIKKIRELGFLVKLDTNGFFPDRLSMLLKESLIDYIAMDIKNSAAKYPITVGIPGLDVSTVRKSVRLIKACGLPYEFRTTLVRGLHEAEDMSGIGELISGAKTLYLQNFADSGDLVGFGSGADTIAMDGFERAEIEHFQGLLAPFVDNCEIRG